MTDAKVSWSRNLLISNVNRQFNAFEAFIYSHLLRFDLKHYHKWSAVRNAVYPVRDMCVLLRKGYLLLTLLNVNAYIDSSRKTATNLSSLLLHSNNGLWSFWMFLLRLLCHPSRISSGISRSILLCLLSLLCLVDVLVGCVSGFVDMVLHAGLDAFARGLIYTRILSRARGSGKRAGSRAGLNCWKEGG